MPMNDLVMRFAAGGKTDVETLVDRLETLTRQRQDLRERRGSVEALERNRLEIVRTQWDLSWALIDRHLPLQPAS